MSARGRNRLPTSAAGGQVGGRHSMIDRSELIRLLDCMDDIRSREIGRTTSGYEIGDSLDDINAYHAERNEATRIARQLAIAASERRVDSAPFEAIVIRGLSGVLENVLAIRCQALRTKAAIESGGNGELEGIPAEHRTRTV